MIGSISGYGYSPISAYSSYAGAARNISPAMQGVSGANAGEDGAKVINNPGESTEVQPGKKSSPAECKTCKERKYQDGSDENVSFKSAAHVSPEAASSAVRSHEQEHVANAYKKAEQKGGKVIQASVSIHTAVCPECGRTYVSGGTTKTQIKYGNEDNPYQKARKAQDAAGLIGSNVNLAG